jgi:hypothetical protein
VSQPDHCQALLSLNSPIRLSHVCWECCSHWRKPARHHRSCGCAASGSGASSNRRRGQCASSAVHGLSEMPVQSLLLAPRTSTSASKPGTSQRPQWRDLPGQETIAPKCPELNAFETWMLHRRRELLTRQDCSAAAVPPKQTLAAVAFLCDVAFRSAPSMHGRLLGYRVLWDGR